MIAISTLSKVNIGKWVIYTDSTGDQHRGRIKSWNDKWIFVVYHCDNDWDNFQDYTAAATAELDLRFTYKGPK